MQVVCCWCNTIFQGRNFKNILFLAQLQPKVDGSISLNKVFQSEAYPPMTSVYITTISQPATPSAKVSTRHQNGHQKRHHH
ncbi:hypothetical protein L1987_48405 [Smallanthus sonchifolius]|uniref:Uncharacterized protein n=1 Tax=Smallanthus sonchifolius TaxID=185202 RepID=A0ACB9FSS5_9ASTR|nr:hypothetical protein L1987_48405 [Smallanthus sonchifolius]